MHFQEEKMQQQKEEGKTDISQLYSLTPPFDEVSQEKKKSLVELAKRYYHLEKKFIAEPFLHRQQYCIISAKWLERWKVYVSYNECTSALPPSKYIGCGRLPTANEDIIQTTRFGNFQFEEPENNYNYSLKPDLQEKKDYLFIGKQMFYTLKDCEDYNMINIIRKVVKTAEGKKIELYYFKVHFPVNQLNLLLIYNSYLKEVEGQRASKFIELNFQYSHYSNVKQFAENIYNYILKRLTGKNKVKFESGLPLRIWLLNPELEKNILYNTIREGCKINSSFQYKLFLDAEFLEYNKLLCDYDILKDSTLVGQLKQEDQNWIFFNNKVFLESTCTNCREKKILKVICSCKVAVYCSTECKKKDVYYHKGRCPNDAQSEQEEVELKLTENSNKGKTGLRNLGNTCFMNSGLQCISHIKEIVDYFVNNHYIKDINKQNPLGTKGQLSTQYAKMIKNLWLGSAPSFSPNHLKRAIAKFQPMFSGYNQHDSGELINYVLDGLHEDLNRVKQKPYVESKDYDGRPDKIVAQQAWEGFRKRNQSIIVDLMYGQYKSIVDCPKCQFESIQFDPFLLCSIPLVNSNKKTIELVFVKDHIFESKIMISYDVKSKPKLQWALDELKNKLLLSQNTKLMAYTVSYEWKILKLDEDLDDLRRSMHYKSIYVRQLFIDENIEQDLCVKLSNTYCNSMYGTQNYRKQIIEDRVYLFNKQITFKQLQLKIYSYFKQFYEVKNFENDVIKTDQKEQPFRIITKSKSFYSICEMCKKKSCDGCELPFNDELLGKSIKSQNKIQIQLYWRKNVQEISAAMNNPGKIEKGSPMKGGMKIQDCIQLFGEPEVLNEQNAWYCPKCKDFVLAKKQMQIYKAPKILLICLKRFKRKQYYAEKIGTFVNYPIEGLDLSKYILNNELPCTQDEMVSQHNDKPIYDLIAVSNHMGSTGGGHFTAYCKDINDNQWYQFDDSHVSKLSNPERVVSEEGYILFYRRR